MTVTPDICIYHANCIDGFSAAWAVWKRFGDSVAYVPATYGQQPPDVDGKHVVIVDFSYKRGALLRMAEKAKTLLILDHHKTAQEDLLGIATPYPWADHIHFWATGVNEEHPRISALFDMERSGAVIAWEYFHPDEKIPKFLLHVQDRDLWRFKVPYSKLIHSYVTSYEFDFERWNDFADQCENEESRSYMIRVGGALMNAHMKTVREMISITRMRTIIDGHDVPVANLPPNMASDAGHLMCQGEPFAATYTDMPEGRTYSLRSTDEGVDVSTVAKKYGGGGHRNAAGFKASHELTFTQFPERKS